MPALDTEKVHKGKGKIVYQGDVIGTASNVDFIIQTLGVDTAGDASRTCYGTVSGKITKTSVIGELSNPRPTPVEIQVELSGGETLRIQIVGVEFIDEIPRDGELDNVEFDGTIAD